MKVGVDYPEEEEEEPVSLSREFACRDERGGPDGRTLAIEHTLIEPFPGDRADFERAKAVIALEADPLLHHEDRIVYVNVPSGALLPGTSWDTAAKCVNAWLRSNLSAVGEGDSYHDCAIAGPGIPSPYSLRLHIRVIAAKASIKHPIIRRYGPTDIPGSVEKALRTKLPKLASTPADVRILLLERNQMRLSEHDIAAEVRKQAPAFPRLKDVTEIWFAETVFYDSSTDPGWRDAATFHRYDDTDRLVESIEFFRGVLISKSRNGVPVVSPDAWRVLGR